MDYYSHTKNKILIGHFPGQTKQENIELIEELKNRKIKIPDNLEIVSVITKDQIDYSPLHYQLKHNKYSYINPLKNRHMIWKRTNKIYYVLQALKETEKEYSLILDGSDVVILSDLTNIIDIFKEYDKNIVYNSTIWMYPHIIIDNVENRGQYGEYCYLNAGCCIGKTKDLINFYDYAWKIIKNTYITCDSEQYYIRKAFNNCQNTVFFDYDCKIFQCWHKAEYIYETDKNTKTEKCFLR